MEAAREETRLQIWLIRGKKFSSSISIAYKVPSCVTARKYNDEWKSLSDFFQTPLQWEGKSFAAHFGFSQRNKTKARSLELLSCAPTCGVCSEGMAKRACSRGKYNNFSSRKWDIQTFMIARCYDILLRNQRFIYFYIKGKLLFQALSIFLMLLKFIFIQMSAECFTRVRSCLMLNPVYETRENMCCAISTFFPRVTTITGFGAGQ